MISFRQVAFDFQPGAFAERANQAVINRDTDSLNRPHARDALIEPRLRPQRQSDHGNEKAVVPQFASQCSASDDVGLRGRPLQVHRVPESLFDDQVPRRIDSRSSQAPNRRTRRRNVRSG